MKTSLLCLSLLLAPLLGCDNGAPALFSVSRLTDTTSAVGPYEVLATATGGRLDSVVLVWSASMDPAGPTPTDDSVSVAMADLGGVWRGVIPGQPVGSVIHYYVVATATDGLETRSPAPISDAGEALSDHFSFRVMAAP